jgi:chorismate mutase
MQRPRRILVKELFTVSDQTVVHRCDRLAGENPPDKLFELAIQRLLLARDVAADKYASRQLIDDPVREHQILQAVASALNASGHCQAGIQFFRDQIEANKAIQRGLHHRWYAHPEEVPPVHGSLAAEVRPKLDHINSQIVWQLKCLTEMPRVSREHLADLADKRLATAVSERQLPRLHRAAALFAMRSLCIVDSTPRTVR